MSADDPVQRLIADACFVEGALDDLEQRARDHGVTAADLAVLTDAPHRLALYRRLVENNLLGVTAKMMPRTRARLNDVAHGAFDRSFDAFLAEAAPRTHYLRDVPAEFLAWVAPRWATDASTLPYAADLAAYELVQFRMAAAPPLTAPDAVADLALDRPVVFCAACRLERYAHAVHLLPEALEDRTFPPAGDVGLLVYRDEENAVRVLELSPLAAAMAEPLLAGEALGTAIAAACRALGEAVTPDVLAGTAKLLADWGERGLLLGAGKVSGPST